jgi:hypothetical protein
VLVSTLPGEQGGTARASPSYHNFAESANRAVFKLAVRVDSASRAGCFSGHREKNPKLLRSPAIGARLRRRRLHSSRASFSSRWLRGNRVRWVRGLPIGSTAGLFAFRPPRSGAGCGRDVAIP